MRTISFCLISSLLLSISLLQASWAFDTEEAVDIQIIGDPTAKVGEQAQIDIKISPKEGYKITRAYRNRVIELSAAEQGLVEFEPGPVRGSIEPDNTLVFAVNVTPKKPGKHPINGIIRFSFIHDYTMDTKSIPLMTTVTGVE